MMSTGKKWKKEEKEKKEYNKGKENSLFQPKSKLSNSLLVLSKIFRYDFIPSLIYKQIYKTPIFESWCQQKKSINVTRTLLNVWFNLNL